MLARGGTLDTRYLIFALSKAAKSDNPNSMNSAWREIMWSMRALARGKFPKLDARGRPFPEGSLAYERGRLGLPICGQFFFAWGQVAADLDYLANYLNLPHFNSNSPCWLCNCDRVHRPFTDFRRHAAWRDTVRTLADIADLPLHHLHPLFQSPQTVGLTWMHCLLDVMHICDLGVTQHVLGNSLWLLVWRAGLTGSFADRLLIVYNAVLEHYRALGTPQSEQMPFLRFQQVFGDTRSPQPSHFPCFGGKAAQCRHLVGPMMRAFCGLTQGQSEHIHVRQLLMCLDRFYTLISPQVHHLPPVVAMEIEEIVERALVHYNFLSSEAANAGIIMWNVVPKHHMWQHMALISRFYNPRMYWVYADEDFVGRIANIAKSVVRGLGPRRVGARLIERYSKYLYICLRKRRGD